MQVSSLPILTLLRLSCLQLLLLGLTSDGGQSEATSELRGASERHKTYIVIMHKSDDPDKFQQDHGIKSRYTYRHAVKGFAAPLSSSAAEHLRQNKRVLAVEEDGTATLCAQMAPTGLVRMGVPQYPMAHINNQDEPMDVDVAILDTGMLAHDDLRVHRTHSVYGSNGADWNGHGTLVAGVLCALDNDVGIVGVAPGVRLWNVQAYGPAPNNTWSVVLGGMDYIAQHADEISVAVCALAMNENFPAASIRAAVQGMVNAGVVFVVVAGNGSKDLAGADGVWNTSDDEYPAAFPESMVVSAMNPLTDLMASFSNFSSVPRPTHFVNSPGLCIDVAAPGVDILTLFWNNGYASFSGTSVAAPHVAGLVAHYIAANGRATNAAGVYRIRQAIIDAAVPQQLWNSGNTGDPDANHEPLAVASEAWVPNPVIARHRIESGSFVLEFPIIPGYDYTPQYSARLEAAAAWTNLTTVAGSRMATNATVSDPIWINGARVYRLLRSPSP